MIGVRFAPRAPLAARIPSSTAIFDEQGRLLRLTLASDQQYRLWTPLDEVPEEFVDALLMHEDRHFYRHAGFNPAALARAAVSSYSGGPRIGGSTITMQLARLMYGLNTRSVGGKLQQIARAVQLEMCYSKRELLEAHLNLMPYGGNIQGIGAASLIYFDKSAARLDLAESLALVLIPQSPARRAPSDCEGDELRSARQRLFARWIEEHPQAADSAQHVAMPLQFGTLRDLPFGAPHFTDYVLQQRQEATRFARRSTRACSHSPSACSPTTSASAAAPAFTTPAALLVDYRDMSVRAMVGSADFSSAAIDGQVNGTLAKRSPGSALKPFIYALAIDQGLIHPLTVLKDAPTSFGPYSPENFDGRFVGPITATEALARSRNVPAVALSAQLTQPSLYEFLQGRRRLAARERAPLRTRAHARRRRSDAGGNCDAVRDARESRPTGAVALSRRRESRARAAPAVGRSELHDARHAAERAAPRRCLRTAPQQRAGRMEDRHVVGLPRCVDCGRLRPVRAGRVGRQLRRLRQSCLRRRAGGRAAVLPHRRCDRRESQDSSSRRFVSRRGWNASTSAAHRAICRMPNARRLSAPGTSPAFRRFA